MVTGLQIRAARALLDWGADRLADEAGLNKSTIHNIEKGATIARGDSLDKITEVFVNRGVEFVGDRGVAFLHDNYRILEGSNCYLQLLDEAYHHLLGKQDAEILSICTDDSVSPPEVVTAIKRWHEAGIKCRFLSHEKATRFDFPLDEYRLISSSHFKNSVMVVYGNKVATLRGTNDSVLVVNDKEQADMLRGLFNLIWSHASKPKLKQKK